MAVLVNQRDKHLIDLFIGRRKPSHGLIQALTDQRAGEHQLGRRRLVRAIGMMRHSRLRRCHIAFQLGPQEQGPCDLQSRFF